MKKTSPPAWVDRMLEIFCSERFLEEVEGDLHEWFSRRAEKQGLRKARLYYFFDAISYLRLFRLKTLKEMQRNNNKLYLNYFIIAIRQFKKNFWHSLLNVLGLSIGLLSVILISIYILDELSYDKFHEDHDKIYRLVNNDPQNGSKGDATPSPWKLYLEPAFPAIEAYTRFGQDIVLVNKDDQNFLENDFYWTESNFLTFFSFDVISGEPTTMLEEPNSVVITRDMAMKYFDRLDVLGEQLPIKVYDGNQDFLMKITGVIENVPDNSHLQFDLLGSMSTTREMYGHFDRVWGLNWLKSYVKIADESQVEQIEKGLPEFFETYRGDGSSEYSNIIFQPLDEVRLYSNDINGKIAKGNLDYVILFGCVAILILIASTMNYVNLVTAKSGQRGKEIGMRKVLGAQRAQVVRQVYVESFVQLFLAVVLAFTLGLLLMPIFSEVVGKEISLEKMISSEVLSVIFTALTFILILSGAYPALILNRFKPIDALRGTQSGVLGNQSLTRKIQVFFQFTIGVFLIACTLVVIRQVQFFNSFDKGFNAEQLINIPVDDRDMQRQLMTMKEQISQVPGVQNITATGEALPSAMNNTWSFEWDGKDSEESVGINIIAIDYDYLNTLETDLVAGRNLNKELLTDSTQSCLLNESAFKITGWTDLEGKKVDVGGNERTVVGVIEDFHYNSLHESVAPNVYLLAAPGTRVSPDNLIVRLDTKQASSAIDEIDRIWSQFSAQPLAFTFVNDAFQGLYLAEQRFVKLIIGFAVIGIFLTILGLLGLVSYMAERKSKELSIRKVLGASQMEILWKFGGQFGSLFLLSLLVALPASWWVMQQWLQTYAYSIELNVLILLAASAVAMLITVMTIGGQAFKVAFNNPVKFLKDE